MRFLVLLSRHSRNFGVLGVLRVRQAALGRQFEFIAIGLQRTRRHAIFPRQIHRIVARQTIIRQTFNWRAVAVCNVFRAFVAADVVADSALAQIHTIMVK